MEISEMLHTGEIIYKGKKIISYDITTMYSETSIAGDNFSAYNLRKTNELINKINCDIVASAIKQFNTLNAYDCFVPLVIKNSNDIMFQSTRMVSVFTDYFYNMGAEESIMERDSQTWDMQNKTICSLKDMFSDCSWRQHLFEGIKRNIKVLEGEMGIPCFVNWESKIYESFEKNRFYLNNDGIVIYIPQGTIASNIWGIPTFLVSYKDINGILKRKFN